MNNLPATSVELVCATRAIGAALHEARRRLAPVHDSAHLDAEVLLAHALGVARTYLHAHPEQVLERQTLATFRDMVERRVSGVPVAYLTGVREFWSLPLEVNEATLIPRPETELLVECALARIPPDAAWRIADLGTGSGAVALAIATERPGCRLLASDCSLAALAIARRNAARLNTPNVAFAMAHWLAPFAGAAFDMIVTNPPYIPRTDPHLQRGDVRFEPYTALASGSDGLDAVRTVSMQARRVLRPGGWLLLEHGYDQGSEIRDLLATQGYSNIHDHNDLAGHGRVMEACKQGLGESP